MKNILHILLIVFGSSCVFVETVEIRDNNPTSKENIESKTAYEFLSEINIISRTSKIINFQIHYTKKEKAESINKVTYKITEKLYLPCEQEKNELCIKNNYFGSEAVSSKTEFFLKMFFASVTIVGLPSWYFYYSALEKDGVTKTDIKVEESKDQKNIKLKPINGFLVLGSTLKSKKIQIKEGKFSISPEELFSIDFESLPNLKDNKSPSTFNYDAFGYVVSDEMKDEKMNFSIFSGLQDEQDKLLDELQKNNNDRICKKYNKEELQTLHNTYISEFNFERRMSREELDAIKKKYTSKELYCTDHYFDTNVYIIQQALVGAANRNGQ
jgi:hypothetical protein